MRVIFIGIVWCLAIGAISCRYQKSDLPPLKGGPKLTQKDTHGFRAQGSLYDNLSEFMARFVKRKDPSDIDGESDFDTVVDYREMIRQQNDYNNDLLKLKAMDRYKKAKADKKFRLENELEDHYPYVKLRNSIIKHYSTTSLEGKSKNEQLAFWNNAYNFVAIEMIISNSIRNGGLLTSIDNKDPYWKKTNPQYKDAFHWPLTFSIAGHLGHNLSLEIIEKTITLDLIRGENKKGADARFHFSFICVAQSCPILLDEPYTGDRLERQLDYVTNRGLALKRIVDKSSRDVGLSRIFEWYYDDFWAHADILGLDGDDTDEKIQAWIRHYSDFKKLKLRDYDYQTYGWNLNKVKEKDILLDSFESNFKVWLHDFVTLLPANKLHVDEKGGITTALDDDFYDTAVYYQKMFDLKSLEGDTFLWEKRKKGLYAKNRAKMLALLKDTKLDHLSTNQKIAFFVNAHNWMAADAMIAHSIDWPIDDVKKTSLGEKIYSDYKIDIAGETMSLGQLKNEIIFKKLSQDKDARLALALSDATLSGPVFYHRPFRDDPQRGVLLDDQLDFITEKSLEKKRIVDERPALSALFQWNVARFLEQIFSNENFSPEFSKMNQGLQASLHEFEENNKDLLPRLQTRSDELSAKRKVVAEELEKAKDEGDEQKQKRLQTAIDKIDVELANQKTFKEHLEKKGKNLKKAHSQIVQLDDDIKENIENYKIIYRDKNDLDKVVDVAKKLFPAYIKYYVPEALIDSNWNFKGQYLWCLNSLKNRQRPKDHDFSACKTEEIVDSKEGILKALENDDNEKESQ